MDEVVGDGVTEPVNDPHTRNKEDEVSSMMQSNDMTMPGMDGYSRSSKYHYLDIYDEKDLDRIGSSGHASASPHCMDNTGIMVEELTLRNYDGENLTISGTASNKERLQTRQCQWLSLHRIEGGSRISNLHGPTGYKDKGQDALKDGTNNVFSGIVDHVQPLPSFRNDNITENLLANDGKVTSANVLASSGGVRTKMLSKTGRPEYFIKSTLTDKGVIHRSQAGRGSSTEYRDPDHTKSGTTSSAISIALLDLTAKPLSDGSDPSNVLSSRNSGDGTSLREWFETSGKKVNKVEKMHIFGQILYLVDIFHSRGIPIQDLRPSCLKLSGSYQVSYAGSSLRQQVAENVTAQDTFQSNQSPNAKRPMRLSMLSQDNHPVKKLKLGENIKSSQRQPQFPSRSGIRYGSTYIASMNPRKCGDEEQNDITDMKNQSVMLSRKMHNSSQSQFSLNVMTEEKWYTSPEMSGEKEITFASNIYSLGVLLFELLGAFDSGRSHAAAMLDLRHRILPPSFLSENPKEAGFCLWLLHPEPSLRPTTREILQSEFMSGMQCGMQESSGVDLSSSIDEELGESELLSYFLLSLNEQKQKDASSLMDQIQRIEADIQEVEKRRSAKLLLVSSSVEPQACENGSTHLGNTNLNSFLKISTVNDTKTRLMSNINQLENAYFSVRSSIQHSGSSLTSNRDEELLKCRHSVYTTGKEDNCNTEDRLGGFFDGLCKYARYSKFNLRGLLRNGEFNNSANVVCSLSFDRDEDYLAAGGVSKKIKIFEFQALFSDSVDIHYPAVEMPNKSKLSCVCWNSYIRNYLASTDYDGTVKLWDVAIGQELSHFSEHTERAWSVDFSRIDPTKLASGSDDRLVKLWSLNDKNSLCTIRNNANVCSVQFSPYSAHLLAFSSADYKTYCYDLRNISTPWCVLGGHEKAVSYAKFLDAGSIVSASTDNTLKIWDLKKTSPNSLSRDACVLTLKGHTNEKNFVGLSAADGYITCGSETNEVFAYYKSLPMPITAHRFGSTDPITGKETEDDNGQFVSSVCWRRKSNMVVAANSSGCIKLLQLV